MTSAKPTVLIVDDDRFVRVFLRDCLSDIDCEVSEAEDGEAALEKVKAQPPALVLLDLMMPRKSGLDVLNELRIQNPGVGVVVISSMDSEGLIAQALEAGAMGFISKPFHPVEISEAVKQALSAVG